MELKNIMFILIVCIISIFALNLTGCAKCISTEYENVEVTILDKYHRSMWMQPMKAGKVTTFITHPAVWEITVEYNGVKYTINDEDIYNKYENKIFQTAIGELKIETYNDGTVKYDIVSLE